MTLAYPPPWQDIGTLAEHISACPNTVENWVAKGILPPPVKRGGKLMWKWSEVDAWLSAGSGPNIMRIADAVRKEREADRRAG